MTCVFLDIPLDESDLQRLKEDFSNYSVEFNAREEGDKQGKGALEKAEVYFGEELCNERLALMPNLKWIHLVSSFVGDYKFKILCDQKNILITHSRTIEITNMAEYVLAWSNLLVKGLDHAVLKQEDRVEPRQFQGMRFLQIGLGVVGSEVARLAKMNDYRVWGIRKRGASFHPYCNKVYATEQLNSLLTVSDVVCCALSKDKLKTSLFNSTSLQHIKKGAILIFLNNCELVDLKALCDFLKSGHIRAAVFDSKHPLLQTVKDQERIFITPAIAAQPLGSHKRSIDIFCKNLRYFLYGNFSEMANIN